MICKTMRERSKIRILCSSCPFAPYSYSEVKPSDLKVIVIQCGKQTMSKQKINSKVPLTLLLRVLHTMVCLFFLFVQYASHQFSYNICVCVRLLHASSSRCFDNFCQFSITLFSFTRRPARIIQFFFSCLHQVSLGLCSYLLLFISQVPRLFLFHYIVGQIICSVLLHFVLFVCSCCFALAYVCLFA